eukprot:15460718-Alexandrium_andersonii.AAC.1
MAFCQAGRQAGTQAGRQTDRQTDKQTEPLQLPRTGPHAAPRGGCRPPALPGSAAGALRRHRVRGLAGAGAYMGAEVPRGGRGELQEPLSGRRLGREQRRRGQFWARAIQASSA